MSDELLALPAPEQPKLLPAPDRAQKPQRHEDPRRRRKVVAIVGAALLVLILVGWFFHHRRDVQAEDAAERERDRLPSVGAITVSASPPIADLRLPGTITPLTEASLFARASGYLTARYVDIGDTVRRGQVLAEIDAPDLDQQVAMARQQLDQARSAVNDAKARVDLSRVTFTRLATLVKDLAVSQQQVDQSKQDLDTANAGLVSSNANVGASQANLGRLTVLQGYEKLRAPFDGVVTARNVDVGALVNGSGASSGSGTSGVPAMSSTSSSAAGSSGTTASTTSSGGGDVQSNSGGAATELFRIAQADRVRVFVTVPQENAASLEIDTDANVFVEGFDKPFDGRLTRTARSLDPSARTLLVEVQVPNPQQQLVPGMFAQVRFRTPRRSTPLLVPGEAVVARADGLHVAVLEDLSAEDRKRLPKRAAGSDEGPDGDKGGDKKGGGDKKDEGGKGASSGAGGDSKKGQKDEGGKQGGGDEGGRPDDDPAHAKRVHLQQVEVGRDYGTEIEITRGLAAGATIVANPGDEIVEGALVLPQRRPQAGAPKQGDEAQPPGGNAAPSMQAPTKGRH